MRCLMGFLVLVATLTASAQEQPPGGNSSVNLLQPVTELSQATPEWFKVGVQYRFRFENRTGNGFREGTSDFYGLGRLLVDVGVEPAPWLSFHFRGQDARAPGKKNATPLYRDPFDVRQAWIQLGDSESGWLRVRAGRQELLYGAQRLVGPLDWTNTARQFDAVKLNVGKKDLNVDVFASSVVVIDEEGFNRHRDGANLHGAYGNLNRLAGEGTLDAYAFWKTTPRVVVSPLNIGDADIYTTGLRYTRSLEHGFDVAAEVVRQFGTFANDNISSWGAYGIIGYKPPDWKTSPRFSVEYQYGSGDDDPNDGKMSTFDQLFPTGHLYQGTADRIGWRNVKDIRAGVTLQLAPKVSLTLDYFSFWLASRNDNLYAVNGSISVRTPDGGAVNGHVGQELDAIVMWRPRGHIAIGSGFGYFITGGFLKETTPGHRSTFGYLMLNYVL